MVETESEYANGFLYSTDFFIGNSRDVNHASKCRIFLDFKLWLRGTFWNEKVSQINLVKFHHVARELHFEVIHTLYNIEQFID